MLFSCTQFGRLREDSFKIWATSILYGDRGIKLWIMPYKFLEKSEEFGNDNS